MHNVIINDVTPREQFTASGGQTVFNTLFTADATTDIDVYARAAGVDADDVTQIVSQNDYTVTFIGGSETVRVTFTVGRTAGDIITIARNTPSTRENLYINTNFTPSMLNQDFGLLTLIDQQNQMYDVILAPHYNVSAIIDNVVDIILPILAENQIWAMNPTRTAIIPYDVPASGGLAPKNATYLIQTLQPNNELPNAQVMGNLASGLVVNTTTTGVQLTRVLTGTANQITMTNGSGIAGNPTVSITPNPTIPGTEYILIPSGTTAQRPVSPTDGMIRYNTDSSVIEIYELNTWVSLSAVIETIIGTPNQIDVDNSDPKNPVISLSSTLNLPGTFTIQGTTVIDSIIDDDSMATATDTNISSSEAVKAYVDGLDGGNVKSVTGTANEIDVDNSDPVNPIVGIADNPVIPGTGGETLPQGTTAQRAGATGTVRFNTQTLEFEGTADGINWEALGASNASFIDVFLFGGM